MSPPKADQGSPRQLEFPQELMHEQMNSPGQRMLSPYKKMILDSYEALSVKNLLVGFFNWVLLAGFIVFPGTFTSLSQFGILNNTHPGRLLQYAARHTSLLCIASICCFVGAMSLCWMWWFLKDNYVWLISRIFFLGLLGPVLALIITLADIYMAQDGE